MSDEQIKRMIVENRGNEEDLFIDIKEILTEATKKAEVRVVQELREKLNFMKGEYGYDEIEDFLAELQESEGEG